MPRKQIIIGLVAAAVVLFLLSQLTTRRRLATAEGGGFVSMVGEVDSTAVGSVKAWIGATPDSAVELRRTGESWVVASAWDWPANASVVDRLFTDLKDIQGERRSSKADVLDDFGIDDEQGMHLVATKTGGTELFHLIAGKQSSGGGSFVRKAGSNDVYLVRKSLRSSFGLWGDNPRPPDNRRWIDLQIVKVDRQTVNRITLSSASGEIVLEKEFASVQPAATDTAGTSSTGAPTADRSNWTWKADRTGEIDKGKADAVLGATTSIRASDVADPARAAEYGFGGEGARSFTLVTDDGSSTRVLFGGVSSDTTMVYVMKDGGAPAKILKNSVDRIFKKRSELKPDAKS